MGSLRHTELALIFHRGCNARAAENSLEGLEEIRGLSAAHEIEVDVGTTRDAVAVLFHDLSLARVCGLPGTTLDLTYADWARQSPVKIPRLDHVLQSFPGQRFLLDLRDDLHPALFEGSELAPHDCAQSPAQLLLEALGEALSAGHRSTVRLQAGTRQFRRQLLARFPGFSVDVAERGTRDLLEARTPEFDSDELDGMERIYLRARALDRDRVEQLQRRGFQVIATASFPYRGFENSRRMIQTAQQVGANGLVVSPLDHNLLTLASG